MGKIWKKIKKVSGLALLLTILLHGATNIAYQTNSLYHSINRSEKREKFESQFGFPLLGWNEDVEDEQSLRIVSKTIELEKITRDFKLESMRIESGNYLKKSFVDQWAEIINMGYEGYYLRDKIVIKDITPGTIVHEIKHAKTYDIVEEHPEFLEKWKKLALGENGQILYWTYSEQFFSKIRGLLRLTEKDEENPAENRRLGFVSDYARKNVYEDIAELGESAEHFPALFVGWFFGSEEEQSEKIKKKVELLQEYGLIPKEFTDFISLEKKRYDIHNDNGYIDEEANDFINRSEEFIRQNPKSVYIGEILRHRASILEEQAWMEEGMSGNGRNLMESATREYKKSLMRCYKNPFYVSSLKHLARIYKDYFEDSETGQIFFNARDEYYRRFGEEEYPQISLEVNDFLEARGVDLNIIDYSISNHTPSRRPK